MSTLDVLAMESMNEAITMGSPTIEQTVVMTDNVVDKQVSGQELLQYPELEMESKEVITPVSPTSPVSTIPPVSSPHTLQDLTNEYQDIDPISSKSTSLSEVEEGQILESSSDASDLPREGLKSSINKRPSSVLSDGSETAGVAKKPKKKISFSAVTAYYFPRAQGFTCIPSQGGSTLGMALKHSHEESFTLAEHANQQRRNHRRLLLQLRKRRKNRSATKASEEDAVAAAAASAIEATQSGSEVACNSNMENKEKCEVKESESEDSDADGQEISDISDSELDVDNYYFLQPVPTRQRRALLRESGVGKIETSEKDDCRQIRVSRESCGCSCQVYCEPESCSCAQSGIQCQVDRLNFPCGCSRDACGNPSGRVEFNPVRVRTHFIHTLMRMELENAQEPNKGLQTLHQSQQLQQHQSLQAIEELPTSEIDGGSAVSAIVPPESHYNWDNVMHLAPIQDPHQQALQHQQHHTGYSISDPLSENGWFSHYSTETNNTYSLYSAANSGSSAEGFPYDQNPYDPLGYHATDGAAETGQHYTELVDSSSSSGYTGGGVGSSSGDFYADYSQTYQTFEPQTFSYHHSTSDSYTTADEIYSYPEDGSTYGLNGLTGTAVCSSGTNGSSVLDGVSDAPKTESSNSSSEEDVLDMGSSLATIVKETMVSV